MVFSLARPPIYHNMFNKVLLVQEVQKLFDGALDGFNSSGNMSLCRCISASQILY